MKLLAQIPFDIGKSYDFYSDRFICDDVEILYENIEAYGYLLSNKSTSINLIPVGNSTTYTVSLFTNEQVFKLDKTASNVMLFKNSKQRTINLIFSELVNCIYTYIAPPVFSSCLDLYQEQGWLNLGAMTLSDNTMVKKTMFGTKELELSDYGHTTIEAGRVKVYALNNKLFYECGLNEYNAPLIGPLLDTLSKR